MAKAKANPKHERFVLEYLKDLNATQAALRAGYSPKTAYAQGARLLKHAEVKRLVKEAQANRQQRLELEGDTYLKLVHELCTFDPVAIFDKTGNVLPLHQWPLSARMALGGHETIIKNAKAGDGVVDEVLKVRWLDRRASLELMLRHLGLLVERKETGKPGEFSTLSDVEKLARLKSVVARIQSKLPEGAGA